MGSDEKCLKNGYLMRITMLHFESLILNWVPKRENNPNEEAPPESFESLDACYGDHYSALIISLSLFFHHKLH